jgi:hypothetical protein
MEIRKQHIEEQIFCPRCLSPLNKGKDLRVYETISEHVMYPNGNPGAKPYYYCSNGSCPTLKFNIFWDSYGEDYNSSNSMSSNLFILNQGQAINSQSRKNAIKSRRIIIDIINIRNLKIELEKYLIPNKSGTKIIGYKYKVEILIKKGIVYTCYTPGIISFLFCLKDFYYDYNSFKNKRTPWTIRDALKHLEYRAWDKRWWKLLSTLILNMIYPKLKKQLESLLK